MRLHDDDQPGLHFGDGRHCWSAPIGVEQTQWEDIMRVHIVEHLTTEGRLTRPATWHVVVAGLVAALFVALYLLVMVWKAAA